MSFDALPFDVLGGLIELATVFGIFLALILLVGFAIAGLAGQRGVRIFTDTIQRAVTDSLQSSPRRILALSTLTFREAIRRKLMPVAGLFVVLIMFAGWFLADTSTMERPELQAKVYVSFVLTAISWLVIPAVLLLACWGIPDDIKARSLHTVVTKPARKNEILLGRILGFSAVGTLLLAFMGVIGYIWIEREVDADLKCRVPVYGQLGFKDRMDADADEGINTGDIWMFRSYIEGATKSRAIWQFTDLDTGRIEDKLVFETRFEAFRTHKGKIGEGLHAELTFVNPATGKEFRHPQSITISEYREGENLIEIDRKYTYIDPESNESEQVDFVDDVIAESFTVQEEDGGESTFANGLTVVVRCMDPGQYIGMARPDLFVSLPPRPFASGFFKSLLGTWLMLVLVVVLGVTASTFVKGPIATFLTFSSIIVGLSFREFATRVVDEEVSGSGTVESAIRIWTQVNPTTPLGEGAATGTAKLVDPIFNNGLWLVLKFIPDFRPFQLAVYPANGFDVPFATGLLPAFAVVAAFLLPCLIIGYISLSLRELETK